MAVANVTVRELNDPRSYPLDFVEPPLTVLELPTLDDLRHGKMGPDFTLGNVMASLVTLATAVDLQREQIAALQRALGRAVDALTVY